MQQTVQLEVLSTEEQAQRHAQVMAQNDQRTRERVAAKNRLNGHAKPEPGDRMWVTTARGIPRRGRAGIRFVMEGRTELIVVHNDPDLRGEIPSGVTPVTVDGAEEILHDADLNVSSRPATDAEAADLRSQLADRDARIAEQAKEITRLKAEARQAATPDPSGGPARLRAARKVPEPDGFGGKD